MIRLFDCSRGINARKHLWLDDAASIFRFLAGLQRLLAAFLKIRIARLRIDAIGLEHECAAKLVGSAPDLAVDLPEITHDAWQAVGPYDK